MDSPSKIPVSVRVKNLRLNSLHEIQSNKDAILYVEEIPPVLSFLNIPHELRDVMYEIFFL